MGEFICYLNFAFRTHKLFNEQIICGLPEIQNLEKSTD
jgi:hypothetical protein